MEQPNRPTWIEINLKAVAHNVERVVEMVGPKIDVLAVVKANAYGHGDIEVARTALGSGATWLGIACMSEAVSLRDAGIKVPILNLGYTPDWQAGEAVRYEVTTTVYSRQVVEALSRAAQDLDKTARVHVKVDTGMGRLGLMPEDVLSFMQDISRLPGVCVDGVFTHMSSADEADLGYAEWQLARFEQALTMLREHHCLPEHVHAANSAATLRLPEARYSMVRLGIAMYGLDPSPEAPCPADFRPALVFKCQIAQVKRLPKGSCVGYGRTFCMERAGSIAVIPVGYADGFRKGPANWGEVLVHGHRVSIVGRVCMDQTMIDVTDVPAVRQGDEVVLIGKQGDETITVDDVARNLGTINYEVVSAILDRVPRVGRED